MSLRRLCTFTAALTVAALTMLPPLAGISPHAHAAVGTVIIEQVTTEKDFKGKDVLGTFGLATPTGVIEGESKLFRSEKPTGNYALTIDPPSGAIPTIEVYNEDTLTKIVDTRTATGILGSGGTLRFRILYDFSLTGTVSVLSKPSGLRATLKGPRGTQDITTPFTAENVPEGNYLVTFILPKECRPIAPIARKLEAKRRLTFEHESICPALIGEAPTPEPKPQPQPQPEPEPARREESPVRVSLSTGSPEVAAGGSARMTLRIIHRGDTLLRNLAVDYRYDAGRAEVQDVREGAQSPQEVHWIIPSLEPGATWEQSFGLMVKESAENGAAIVSTATVTGDAFANVRLSDRSATARLMVLKTLPKTGVPLLDILTLLWSIMLLGLTGAAAGLVLRKRAGGA